MDDLGRLGLVEFCVFSQRLGASRGMTWKTWKSYNDPGVSFAVFVRAWDAAKASEALAARYPGLADRGPS